MKAHTLIDVAARCDAEAEKLEATKASFQVGTTQDQKDAHTGALRESAAAWRRGAEIIRMQAECES